LFSFGGHVVVLPISFSLTLLAHVLTVQTQLSVGTVWLGDPCRLGIPVCRRVGSAIRGIRGARSTASWRARAHGGGDASGRRFICRCGRRVRLCDWEDRCDVVLICALISCAHSAWS
jgi:hypothetical protein